MQSDPDNHFSLYGMLLASVLLVMFSDSARAASYQSHKSIFSAAKVQIIKQFTAVERKKINIEFGKLDSRLKLRRCTVPLKGLLAGKPRKTGRMTVGVKCTDSKPWSMNVPVTVSMFQKVVVASKGLQRGDMLDGSNIRLESRDIANLPYGYLDDLSGSIGLELKRRINAGTSITPAMVKKPKIISRGQKVSILAMAGSMQVRMIGKAMANGAVGDRISVMNTASKRKLEGVVAADGTVRVDL